MWKRLKYAIYNGIDAWLDYYEIMNERARKEHLTAERARNEEERETEAQARMATALALLADDKELSVRFYIARALADANISEEETKHFVDIVSILPIKHGSLLVRMVCRAKPQLVRHAAITWWAQHYHSNMADIAQDGLPHLPKVMPPYNR